MALFASQTRQKLFRIAEILSGDIVQTLVLRNCVFSQQREPLGGRHEAPANVNNLSTVRGFEFQLLERVITTGNGKHLGSFMEFA
jgi:hypothetical protein